MRRRKISLAIAGLALAASALVSSPAIAQSTSDTTNANEDGNLDQLGYLAIFAVIALVIGIGFAGGDDNNPVSP